MAPGETAAGSEKNSAQAGPAPPPGSAQPIRVADDNNDDEREGGAKKRGVPGNSGSGTGPGAVMGRGRRGKAGTSREENTKAAEQGDIGKRVGRPGTNPAVSAGDCPGSEQGVEKEGSNRGAEASKW